MRILLIAKNSCLGAVYAHFESVILSHEIGMTKDNPAIFDKSLAALRVSAEEAVFIDDVERFAQSAASKCIHPIVFKNADQLRKDLRKAGFDVAEK